MTTPLRPGGFNAVCTVTPGGALRDRCDRGMVRWIAGGTTSARSKSWRAVSWETTAFSGSKPSQAAMTSSQGDGGNLVDRYMQTHDRYGRALLYLYLSDGRM